MARNKNLREQQIKARIRDDEKYEVRSIDHKKKRKNKRIPNKTASLGENFSDNDQNDKISSDYGYYEVDYDVASAPVKRGSNERRHEAMIGY